MAGTELSSLTKYSELYTLKFGNNLIKTLSELEPLVIHTLLRVNFTIENIQKPEEFELGWECSNRCWELYQISLGNAALVGSINLFQ